MIGILAGPIVRWILIAAVSLGGVYLWDTWDDWKVWNEAIDNANRVTRELTIKSKESAVVIDSNIARYTAEARALVRASQSKQHDVEAFIKVNRGNLLKKAPELVGKINEVAP